MKFQGPRVHQSKHQAPTGAHASFPNGVTEARSNVQGAYPKALGWSPEPQPVNGSMGVWPTEKLWIQRVVRSSMYTSSSSETCCKFTLLKILFFCLSKLFFSLTKFFGVKEFKFGQLWSWTNMTRIHVSRQADLFGSVKIIQHFQTQRKRMQTWL